MGVEPATRTSAALGGWWRVVAGREARGAPGSNPLRPPKFSGTTFGLLLACHQMMQDEHRDNDRQLEQQALRCGHGLPPTPTQRGSADSRIESIPGWTR